VNITATLLGQIVAFVLLIYFVNRVLWGPVSKMLDDRQKRIADGLAASEKGKHELELAEKRAKESLVEAKAKAAEILAQAERRASEIVEQAKLDARDEGQRILASAQADLEKEVHRAKETLRGQVSSIAVAGASRILKREINAKAHEDLMKDLVAQI
jgi:F-type H+-transporting ATPase subunit b